MKADARDFLSASTLEGNRETRLTGLAVSDGIALGKVCLFREHRHEGLPEIRITSEQIAAEHWRLPHQREPAPDTGAAPRAALSGARVTPWTRPSGRR